MSVSYPHLFSPFDLAGVTLANRIVMAPMSTNLGAHDGTVTPAQIAFYRARAAGGVGMIVVEFCCVDAATGRSEDRQLILESPEQLAGHQRLVEAIVGAGSVACLQLQHGGQGARRSLLGGRLPLVPSAVYSRRDPTRLLAAEMSDTQIEALIEHFGRSAELGVKAGYQVVELHGAHGYLLTSFLSPFTNHRDDRWGGDEERRLEFARRVIARVKQAIGARPLSFRLSADEFTPLGLGLADMERIAPKLVAAGVDALHVSMGLGWTGLDKVIDPMSSPEGWRLPYARRIRAAAGVPVITVGQIRHPEVAERAIRDGDADFVALGRPLLADPQWASKARAGQAEEIRPCTSCNYCVSRLNAENGFIACAENPRAGRELEMLPDAGSLRGRRAIVVGGGPGGLSAALMLDQAGFATELIEARSAIGGGLVASAAPPHKDMLDWYRVYLEHRIAASNVAVSLGAVADPGALGRARPALVVLAHGARAVRLPIPGIGHALVLDAYEVLMGDQTGLPQPGGLPILVYGGGETGCEAAEYLGARGHEVILVTRSSRAQLARSAEPIYRGVLLRRLDENRGLRVLDETSIEAIAADGQVSLLHAGGQRQVLPVARVLVAQGRRPDTGLQEALVAAGIACVAIGDARKGGRIGDAVHDAYGAVQAVCMSVAQPEQLAC